MGNWFDSYTRGRWLVRTYLLDPLVDAQARDRQWLRRPPSSLPASLTRSFARGMMGACAKRAPLITMAHALVHSRRLTWDLKTTLGAVIGSMIPQVPSSQDKNDVTIYLMHCQTYPGQRVRSKKCLTP